MQLNEFSYQAYEADISSRTLNGKQAISYLKQLSRSHPDDLIIKMIKLIDDNTKHSLESRRLLNSTITKFKLPTHYQGIYSSHLTEDTPVLFYPGNVNSYSLGDVYGNRYRNYNNSIASYSGTTEHYFITSVPVESLPKLSQQTLNYIALTIANIEHKLVTDPEGAHIAVNTILTYLKKIVHSNPEYEEKVASYIRTLYQTRTESYKTVYKNLLKETAKLNIAHQLVNDFEHNPANYNNTRYQHTSFLKD